MLHRDVPIFFGYAQPFVRGLHISAEVHARPASRRTELIDDKLTNPCLAVIAQPDKEPTKFRVSRKPNDEIVSHRRQRVVSAEPLVQRVALLSRSRLIKNDA